MLQGPGGVPGGAPGCAVIGAQGPGGVKGTAQPLASARGRAIIGQPPEPSHPRSLRLMSQRLSRRRFLQTTAAVAASAYVAGTADAGRQPARADRLRLGVVGLANRGPANLAGVRHEEIVALCD